MKRIDYETHNKDEWKIVYSYKSDHWIQSGWIQGSLFKKRKKKKWYEKTWEYINKFSAGVSGIEEIKDLQIKEYYEKENKYEKLKKFFENILVG